MAGMLAGVECARRRRFHHGSRRSSFCLYTTNSEIHHSFVSSLSDSQKRMTMKQEEEETLVGEAREAKQRLEERLSGQRRKVETIRVKGREKMKYADGTREVLGSKKKGGSTRFSWTGLGWKLTSEVARPCCT